MKMLARLRYLLDEGFEVGNLSGYDASKVEGPFGIGRITFVQKMPDGGRQLVTEEFSINAEEARLCSQLFLSRSRES